MKNDNLFFDLKRLKYLGTNCIIGKTVRIRKPEECIIGDGTIIDDFAYISCTIEIGKECHIGSHCSISGGDGKFKMGFRSTLSSHCSVHCATSDYSSISLDLPSVPEEFRYGGEIGDITIKDYVVIGSHSAILPNTTIPNYCAFGAFSLIKGNVEYTKNGLYAGIPAKLLKLRK